MHITGAKRTRRLVAAPPIRADRGHPGQRAADGDRKLKVVSTSAEGPERRASSRRPGYSAVRVPGSHAPDLRLVTAVVVNEAHGSGPVHALFQVGFQVTASGGAADRPVPRGRPVGPRRGRAVDSTCSTATGDLRDRARLRRRLGHAARQRGAAPWTGSGPSRSRLRGQPASPRTYTSPTRPATGFRLTVSMQALADGLPEGDRPGRDRAAPVREPGSASGSRSPRAAAAGSSPLRQAAPGPVPGGAGAGCGRAGTLVNSDPRRGPGRSGWPTRPCCTSS